MQYTVLVDVKASIGIQVTADSLTDAVEQAKKKMNGSVWRNGIEYNDGNMRVSGVYEQNDFGTEFDEN